MNKSPFLENSTAFGTSLQPREQRLAGQICELLESFGPMRADEISRRLKEKQILVLSLLDKLDKQGELRRFPDGRFSLGDDETVEEDVQPEEAPYRDTSEPANRIAQARFVLDVWRRLQAKKDVCLTMNRGIEARVGEGSLLRIQIGAAGVPTVEIWTPSEDGTPRLAQTITVWGQIQADRAMELLTERFL